MTVLMQCGEICGWKHENTGLLGNVNVETPHLKKSTFTTHGIVLRVDAFYPIRHNSLFPLDHKTGFKYSTPQHLLLLSGAISEPKVHPKPRNLFDIALTFYFWSDFGELPFSIRYLLQRGK